MNNEQERDSRGSGLSLSWNLREECKKIITISGALAKIWTKHILSRSQTNYCWAKNCSISLTGGGGRVSTRAVLKVRWLTLLLRVGTLWRCDDGLFFEVPPLARDALLTTLHPLLENMPQTVDHFEISCLGAPFSWLEKPKNRMGRELDCTAEVLMGFHWSTLSKPNTEFKSDLAPCDLWAFPAMKWELRGKKFRSDQRSAARFREMNGAL
jgi:hypothetical protein